jgi:predicted class III extradiol MEMO1 family dioxygenase
MDEQCPQVRPLEPIPVDLGEQQIVVLRDPFHFIEEQISVSVPTFLLLTLMDGTRSVSDLQGVFEQRFGHRLQLDEILKVIQELDHLGLLQNERFEALRQQRLSEFRNQPVREAAHAGAAYESDPAALDRQIAGFYSEVNTRGLGWEKGTRQTIQGVVVPHIDPQVGGICSAYAFAALAQADPAPDLFVLLGTAHQPTHRPFILTNKSFRTPLGVVETCQETANALREACPFDLMEDEYLHKFEHSLEFPILFLQHLYGEPSDAGSNGHPHRRPHPFKILPILVGSFHEYIAENEIPSETEGMRLFVQALQKTLEASGKRVCYVVGADLSHMGKKFGDEEGLTESQLDSTRRLDAEMLEHVEAMRTEDFFRHLQVSQDAQKVCGLPPIYTMMTALTPTCSGKLLNYDLHQEPQTDSFVSFASLVFYEDPNSEI